MTKQTICLATFLAPNMAPVYQFITDYIGQKLGLSTRLIVGASFEQFSSGEADAGFICGLPYVELTNHDQPAIELLAAPVLQGERYQGLPIYFSDVIVRHDSPVQSFADLRGRSWAYNEPNSHSGYGVTLYRLAQMGETERYFGRIVEAGFHQRTLRLVCAGQVDASAIDCQVLAIELRERPELISQLRIIDTLGPSSIQPVVVARRLPQNLKADLRTILLEMGDDPAARGHLAHGFIERFAPVSDADYNDIRQMLAIVKRQNLWLRAREAV